MFSENFLKFFKKNGLFLAQITIIVLPFTVFFVYLSMSENADNFDVASLEKIETVPVVASAQPADKPASDKKKEEVQPEPSTFEVDEVSQEMLNKSAGNPKEMLAGNSPCASFENVQTLAKHTGTISKAKNIEQFKKPLPAMITETSYSCVDAKGEKKTKFTTMGMAVDAEANVLRCIQSNSDETMDSEARFKHVVKIMTHHCGFKLAELRPISTATTPTSKQP